MPSAGRCPKPRAGLSTRQVRGETVVLDRGGLKVHQLNESASFIWGLCTGRLTEAEIASRVARKFAVEPAQATKDVKMLVAQLRQLGLLNKE